MFPRCVVELADWEYLWVPDQSPIVAIHPLIRLVCDLSVNYCQLSWRTPFPGALEPPACRPACIHIGCVNCAQWPNNWIPSYRKPGQCDCCTRHCVRLEPAFVLLSNHHTAWGDSAFYHNTDHPASTLLINQITPCLIALCHNSSWAQCRHTAS